ncbi:hypothetical protein L211DRAFT_843134 [Terfezia boudieri ATCC MYA-4762]|uniref:Uncharacterized protein n=1 Tax=Terfezia boudieri ATCC MYA-4762 TaxID=1051890 RepID=A0A3N4LB88_9PEZI|nr:hypothetical protein L211DRAFT_843134 [Terfezia boudieri ATCC MYA-4762]
MKIRGAIASSIGNTYFRVIISFHLDTEVKVLTTVQWDTYLMMFAECGMKVYELGTVWVEEEGSLASGMLEE